MLRYYAGAALEAELVNPLDEVTNNVTADALTNWPAAGPFSAVIDKGTANEEKWLVASHSGGNMVISIRGYDGTTPKSHSAGAKIRHCFTSIDAAEANAHVNASAGVHGLNAGDPVVGRGTPAVLLNKVISALDNTITDIPLSAFPDVILRLDAIDAKDAVQEAGLSNRYTKVESDARYIQSVAPSVPPGALMPYAAGSAPSGWLLCDGSAVSRSTYSALFAVIGTTFGNGNGTSTFNVPDLRGKTPIGSSSTHPLGATGGAESVALSVANLANHTHTLSGAATSQIPEHAHAYTAIAYIPNRNYLGTAGTGYSLYNPAAGDMTGSTMTTGGGGAHSHSVTGSVSSAGSGTPVSVLQPFAALTYIIKA